MLGKGRSKGRGSTKRSPVEQPEAGFDGASYRRGTTLNSFTSDELSKTERQRLRQLQVLRRRVAGAMTGIIMVLGLSFAMLTQFTGTIRGVKSGQGVKLTESQAARYLKLINDYFANNSFERFSFARRASVLLQFIEKQAPEVAAIKLNPSGLASSEIEVTVRQPVAMWIDAGKTNFVDEAGVVFGVNYFKSPAISIEDNSGVNVDGRVATSAKFLSFVGKTAVSLQKDNNLKVVRVVVPKGSARYIEIFLEGRSYPFKAQITRDAASQAHDIAVMTRYIDNKGVQPQYIDCRVEGKAYWK